MAKSKVSVDDFLDKNSGVNLLTQNDLNRQITPEVEKSSLQTLPVETGINKQTSLNSQEATDAFIAVENDEEQEFQAIKELFDKASNLKEKLAAWQRLDDLKKKYPIYSYGCQKHKESIDRLDQYFLSVLASPLAYFENLTEDEKEVIAYAQKLNKISEQKNELIEKKKLDSHQAFLKCLQLQL